MTEKYIIPARGEGEGCRGGEKRKFASNEMFPGESSLRGSEKKNWPERGSHPVRFASCVRGVKIFHEGGSGKVRGKN